METDFRMDSKITENAVGLSTKSKLRNLVVQLTISLGASFGSESKVTGVLGTAFRLLFGLVLFWNHFLVNRYLFYCNFV